MSEYTEYLESGELFCPGCGALLLRVQGGKWNNYAIMEVNRGISLCLAEEKCGSGAVWPKVLRDEFQAPEAGIFIDGHNIGRVLFDSADNYSVFQEHNDLRLAD